MDFKRLAGTTALAVVSVCCASAEDIKLPGDWRGSIHGFGLVNYSARPDFEASPGGDGLGEHSFLLADQRVLLKLEAHSPKGAVSLLAKPEFFYDAVDEEFGADLREGYLDFSHKAWDVRVGRQILTWGVGDLVFINDVFPKDYAAFFSGCPLEYLKLGVEAVGTKKVGEVREGQRRFPLVVRLPDALRTDPDALAATLIPTASGAVLPVQQVAQIVETEGPAAINREWARRRVTVQANVRGRDVAGFVAEARRKIAEQVELPAGYFIEWGGQFEHLERANRRLRFIVPLALGLIVLLLYFSLGSLRDVGIVATGIPLGAVGGVLALWLRDMPFTVSAAIGFVALSGVAMLNGLVLVTFIRQRLAAGAPLASAVREGCRLRLRPVLMTGLVAALGFVPMALNTGVGAEVQRPLATVVIGGLVTNTLLTLLVLPALYTLFGARTAAVAADVSR